MKHAVLIMAHKNKKQLIRLIKSINCDEFDFYVHCDSNWKLSHEDLSQIKDAGSSVYMIKQRIHGELDQWSLVQIEINMLLEMDNINQYSYFLLLSGQDYPIKSKKYILEFLEEQYPKPMIDIEKYDDKHWVRTKFMLVRYTHKIDELHDKYKPGLYRKIRVAPYVIAECLEKLFMVLHMKEFQNLDINCVVEVNGGYYQEMLSNTF